MKKFVEVSQLHVDDRVYCNAENPTVSHRVYTHVTRMNESGCDQVELGLEELGVFYLSPFEKVLVGVPESEQEAAAAQWHEDMLKMSVGIQSLLGKPRNREELAAIVEQITKLAATFGHPVLCAWKR